jgi:hypothetical protein
MAGVLVAGLVVVVGAQPGGGFGFGRATTPDRLVLQKAVQEDLKITDEQVESAKTFAQDFGMKRLEMFKDSGIDFKGGFGKGGKVDPEVAEKLAVVNAKIEKAAYEDIGKFLKPDQVKRLKQISVQASGVNAFNNAEVVAALKLNDSQKSSIKGITADFNKDRQEMTKGLFGGKGKVDPEKQAEVNKKVDKLQQDAIAKVIDTFNDDQKKAWKEMTGAAFDVSKLTSGFGGGGFKKKDKE